MAENSEFDRRIAYELESFYTNTIIFILLFLTVSLSTIGNYTLVCPGENPFTCQVTYAFAPTLILHAILYFGVKLDLEFIKRSLRILSIVFALSVIFALFIIYPKSIATGKISNLVAAIASQPYVVIILLYCVALKNRREYFAFIALLVTLSALVLISSIPAQLYFVVIINSGILFFLALVIAMNLIKSRQMYVEINLKARDVDHQNQKLNEDVRNKSENLATMVRTTQMLAHDIRRPLSMAKAVLHVLGASRDQLEFKEKRDRFFPEIDATIARVNTMMEDILRMEDNTTSRSFPEINLISAIQNGLKIAFVDIDTPIRIHYKLEHQRMIFADSGKIERVFLNLVVNALKASRLNCEFFISSKDIEGFVEVRIGNTNSYVPKDKLEAIFEPFYTSDRRSNTGLGLSICRNFIERFGGDLYCVSTEDPKYTEFVFTVPIGRASDSIARELPSSARDFSLSVKTKREGKVAEIKLLNSDLKNHEQTFGRAFEIVILEDEPLYIDLLQSFTGQLEPANVYYRRSLEEFDIDASKNTDLLICDIDLGHGDDGFQIIESFRKMNSSARICVHSNRGLFEYQKIGYAAGSDLFLPKPMSEEHFVALVKMTLKTKPTPSMS